MNKNLKIIAGPCVIESYEMTYNIAKSLSQITKKYDVDFTFKASFDKANRSSIESFRGPGLEAGMQILKEIKNNLNIKITTDVHESYQPSVVADVVDIIQIPAFLCRQTDLIIEAAKTGKTVNVKKAQFLAPESMINVIEKITSTGNENIYLTERGSMNGPQNLVVDMTSIPRMKKFGFPVIFDATHSVQKPSTGKVTGGDRKFVSDLAICSLIMGADGVFLETHPTPNKALSDGLNMIELDKFESLIRDLIFIKNFKNNNEKKRNIKNC